MNVHSSQTRGWSEIFKHIQGMTEIAEGHPSDRWLISKGLDAAWWLCSWKGGGAHQGLFQSEKWARHARVHIRVGDQEKAEGKRIRRGLIYANTGERGIP